MPRPFSPDEDAILAPYVARAADWKAIKARLPHRGLRGAMQRLVRLRRAAGTLWRIDQSERARNQPRAGNRFA